MDQTPKPDRKTKIKGEEIAARIIPALHQFIAGRLWEVKIYTTVKNDTYYDANNLKTQYFQLQITMVWNGLCDRLRMSNNGAYFRMAIHDADAGRRFFEPNSEQAMLKDAMRRISADIKIQERRRDIVSRGGYKAMRLDPVLAWHLENRNIDANAFKYEALCHKKPMGITVEIDDDLIRCRLRLSEEVLWSKGALTLKGGNLPITLAQNFIGRPAIEMIEHPALAHLIVKTIKNKFDKTRQKATITVQTMAA